MALISFNFRQASLPLPPVPFLHRYFGFEQKQPLHINLHHLVCTHRYQEREHHQPHLKAPTTPATALQAFAIAGKPACAAAAAALSAIYFIPAPATFLATTVCNPSGSIYITGLAPT